MRSVDSDAEQFSLLELRVDIQPSLLSNPHDVAGKTFDYIIAGGGLTGLTVAAKLTEDPEIEVPIIEKGFYESNNGPIIENPATYGKIFGTSADQNFPTVPLINNRTELIKSCGNSWTRPDKAQVNSWALFQYMNKGERSRPPTEAQIAAGHFFDSSCHGFNGSVHAGYRDTGEPWSPLIKALLATASEQGIPTQVDFHCGRPRGVSIIPNNLLDNQVRADAAREWLLPNYQRPNLKVLTGQVVRKVLFDEESKVPSLKAIGVNFGTHKSVHFDAYARREVLLAAGSSISPLILEYSGIDVKSILDKANTTTTVQARSKPAGFGQGQAVYFANFTETFGEDAPRAIELLDTKLDEWAETTVAQGGFHNATALKDLYELYRDWLLNNDIAFAELFMDAWGQIKFDVWNLIPFTRGSANDPKFYFNELVWCMEQYFNGETVPGERLAYDADIEQWAEYVTEYFWPNYHAVGTCSMTARELGLSSRFMTVFYGMALKIADTILDDHVEA
ncbi:GMC oxidoreductase-domain-containing protein [Aspergillus foveolatus]|uniref:GMC oxidoreductase-domain-containing protein n=1 Tax=Aspergillus foveolatus TaxID=210207 RepID=UPI003CCDA5CC